MPLDGLRRAHHRDKRPRAGDDMVRAQRGDADLPSLRGRRAARPLLVVGTFGPGARMRRTPFPPGALRAQKSHLRDSRDSDAACDRPCLSASPGPPSCTPTRSPSSAPPPPSYAPSPLATSPLPLTAPHRPSPPLTAPHCPSPPLTPFAFSHAVRWRKGRSPASRCAPTARTAPRSSHRRTTAALAT